MTRIFDAIPFRGDLNQKPIIGHAIRTVGLGQQQQAENPFSIYDFPSGLALDDGANRAQREVTGVSGEAWASSALSTKGTAAIDLPKDSSVTKPPSIYDPNGFSENGPHNFFDIWGNGLGHGKSAGSYGAYGDFIADVVKPMIHDRPQDAVVDQGMWNKVSTNTGFLFQNGDQLNQSLGYTLGKLDGQYKELATDGWSLSFLTANQISKQAANGGVGDMLLSDKHFLDPLRGVTLNEQQASHESMHSLNAGRMYQLADQEGISRSSIDSTLNDRLGISTTNGLFGVNGRAGLQAAKDVSFLDGLSGHVDKALAADPAADKVRFNINIQYLPKSEGDYNSGAFVSAQRGLEYAQQSSLKDFGLSTDPSKPNQLSFIVSGEEELAALTEAIDRNFTATGGKAEIGEWHFSRSQHGGEEGSALNQAGLSSDDKTSFDARSADDARVFERQGEVAAKHGATAVKTTGDSCHSGVFDKLTQDDWARGIQKGLAQRQEGTDATVELRMINNGVNPGYTPANNPTSTQGYMTYEFDTKGGVGLNFRMSNSSLSTTEVNDFFIDRGTNVDQLQEGEGRQEFYDQSSQRLEETRKHLEEAQTQAQATTT